MGELAASGIPMTVTRRVLKLSRQPYYRWLADPITDSEVIEAYRANALFNAHRDDPEFGHRLLADEARDAGESMAGRTAWRICRDNAWWSAFDEKRARNGKKPGPPVHDYACLVIDDNVRTRREFTADAANQLWLTDIPEHTPAEGKLYLCAIKDVFSNRIVGYSIDSRMKSRLAVNALENAVARRGDVAGCMVHSDRESPNFDAGSSCALLPAITWSDRWALTHPAATTPRWNYSSACCRTTSPNAAPGPPDSNSAARLSPGSNGPTTAVGGSPAWDALPQSNLRPS